MDGDPWLWDGSGVPGESICLRMGSAASLEFRAEVKMPVCQRDDLRRLRGPVSLEIVSVVLRREMDTYHARGLVPR